MIGTKLTGDSHHSSQTLGHEVLLTIATNFCFDRQVSSHMKGKANRAGRRMFPPPPSSMFCQAGKTTRRSFTNLAHPMPSSRISCILIIFPNQIPHGRGFNLRQIPLDLTIAVNVRCLGSIFGIPFRQTKEVKS